MGAFFTVCALGVGMYFIVTEYVLLPSRDARKAISASRIVKDRSWIEVLLDPLTKFLEEKIPWNDYKMEKLDLTLKTVGKDQTARRYCAEAMAQAAAIAVFAFPLLFVFFPLALLPAGMAVFSYHRDMKEPDKLLKIKRDKIEAELPKFASTISNSLHTTKDVIRILTSYRKVCGDELREELDITLADMKSGTDETALRKLEGRIGSPKLSELVRGLLSVLRGEDQAMYFSIKNEELRKEYIERQKRDILMRPGKLKGVTVATVVLMIVIFIYIFVAQIAGSYAQLF
ncbi:MAG: hypothetical protein ACERKO_08975 [Acetanaerobacterium sp.]